MFGIKERKRKKIILIIISIFVISQLSVITYAHSDNLSHYFDRAIIPQYEDNVYYVGNENIGWSVDESYHTNGSKTTFKFETGNFQLSNEYKSLFAQAAAKWSSVMTFEEKTTGTIVGNVSRISNPFESPAVFNGYDTDNNNHFTSWNIQINVIYEEDYSPSQYVVLIAHELGHAIGLNDLYQPQNYNKLMCGEADYITATAATSYDLWGARVITGQHTTHRWTPTLNNHTCTMCGGVGTHSNGVYACQPTNASVHTINVCSVCNYTYTESHGAYYNQLLGRCSKCGYTGSIVLGLGNEIE